MRGETNITSVLMGGVQKEIKDYNIIRSATSDGFSISGNGVADVEVDIPAVSGYTALFAAITGSNLSYMVPIFPCAYVPNASTTKVAFRLRNLDSTSQTGRTITAMFFYKRTL